MSENPYRAPREEGKQGSLRRSDLVGALLTGIPCVTAVLLCFGFPSAAAIGVAGWLGVLTFLLLRRAPEP